MAKTITDLLLDITINIMSEVVDHYSDKLNDTNICRIIERGIGKRLSSLIPDMYTEVEVNAVRWADSIKITTSFMIDGEIKETASHIADAPYDPTCLNEYFRSHSVSMGVSSRGITFEDVPTTYELKDKPEGYWVGTSTGRGSRVETLPGGQGLGELDDLEYFRQKVMIGLKLPDAPIECAVVTPKPQIDFTESIFQQGLKKTINPPYTIEKFAAARAAEDDKPTIDFSQISQLSAPAGRGLPRYESGIHVGIDINKYDVVTTTEEDIEINRIAIEMRDEIDKQIINDLVCAAAKVEDAGVNNNDLSWNTVPTFGWTHEVTNWDNPFGSTITTNNKTPSWFNPHPSTMEEISFTEEELDELIDLIHDCKSEVMKFK